MKKGNWKWYVYIIECLDGTFYTGMTWNYDIRGEQHRLGKGSEYTKKHGFKKVVYIEEFENLEEARLREKQKKESSSMANGANGFSSRLPAFGGSLEQYYFMLHAKTKHFEGPLDLLLSLIEERKLDITTIALAEVTEQFLQYIKQLQSIEPTVLADYLSIAAKLLVIKSKAILPTLELEPEEEDAGFDLEGRLLLYKQFKEVAKYLKKLDNRRRQSFTRSISFEQKISFYPDPNVNAKILHDNILKVLSGLKELDALPKAKLKEAVSIQEKIDHLQGVLSGKIETRLSDLLQSAKNKGEVIVTFLALLELIKQKIFVADQETLFAEVVIKKYQSQNNQEPEIGS